jgi:phospholipase/carboxylesterase
MKQGKSIAATLPHLVFLPTSMGKNFPVIIALHGRGADENDLVPVVLALELPGVVAVTPRAPFAFPYGGYSWYNFGKEGVPKEETFRTSLGLFRKFVEEVKAAYPVDPGRLILLGFSQGTVIAYATVLQDPSAFRGIAGLSGYVPHQSDVPLQVSKLRGFPVFISHGSSDMMIPVRLGRESAELLKRAGVEVTYREYPMGHEVTEKTIRDLKEWMHRILLSD